MNLHRRYLLNFNKEILFGEGGAILGAQSFVFLRIFLNEPKIYVPYFAVLGSIFGATAFFLIMRYFDQKKEKLFTIKRFAEDLAYFAPVSSILTFLIYYPIFFYLENYFLILIQKSFYATFFSQSIAFVSFLVLINIYRYLVLKFFKKEL